MKDTSKLIYRIYNDDKVLMKHENWGQWVIKQTLQTRGKSTEGYGLESMPMWEEFYIRNLCMQGIEDCIQAACRGSLK